MKIQKRKINHEDLIHKQFAATVRFYESINKLNCLFWTYSASGEKRSIITGALLKAKGLKRGQPDYHFFYNDSQNITHNLFIEFKKPDTQKSKKGKQGEEQVLFENTFKQSKNSNYHLCYSTQEAEILLKKYNIIK